MGLAPQGHCPPSLTPLILPVSGSWSYLRNLTTACPLFLVQPPLCNQMNPVKRLIEAGYSSAQNPPMAPSYCRQKQKFLPWPQEGLPCRPLTCIGSKALSQILISNFDFFKKGWPSKLHKFQVPPHLGPSFTVAYKTLSNMASGPP